MNTNIVTYIFTWKNEITKVLIHFLSSETANNFKQIIFYLLIYILLSSIATIILWKYQKKPSFWLWIAEGIGIVVINY